MKKIDVTEYVLDTEKFSPDFSGFKFIMLTDLHSNEYKINLHEVNKIIKREKPDAILVTGDMVNGKLRDDCTDALNYLIALAKHFPVFYALGNHEYRMKMDTYKYGDKFEQIYKYLTEAGVNFVEDETVYLEKKGETIALSGLEIDTVFYGMKHPVMGNGLVEKHLGVCHKSNYNLLLAHNPEYFYNYSRWGADLTLSGHVHGGIIRVPGIGGLISTSAKLAPKFDAGLYESANGSKMIIGRGLGTHTIRVRINNNPEVVIVKILAKQSRRAYND